METRLLSENSRLYLELGSVWVKTMANQKREFTVLTYNPGEKRPKTRVIKLVPAGVQPTKRVTTTRGTYELGASAWLRTLGGEPKPIADLNPGDVLQAVMLHNQDGLISVETIYRDIWLHELVEADASGYKMNLTPRPDTPPVRSERILRIEESPAVNCYAVDFGEVVPPMPTANTCENLLLWSDGTSFGSGIYGVF